MFHAARLALLLIVAVSAIALSIATPAPAVAQAPEGWAHVSRVIDGDTVELDDGTRVRLFGVSAPELDARCGPEARDVLAGMLADRDRGNWVSIEYGPRTVDDFGRTLGYLWVYDAPEDTWSLLDEWMVILGFGEAWTEDGQYRDTIIDAENTARANGAGCLWAGSTPPPPPPPAQTPPPPPPATSGGNCHPSYPTVCLPYPPDLDCGEISARRFAVHPPDPHRLDGDGDGVGCE